MKRIYAASLCLTAALCVSVFAQGGTGRDIGVGARAFAFAGNHVAAVNDLSATYWNPAALAFLPVREFQASFDIARTVGVTEASGGGISELPGAKMEDYRDRLRLRGIGAMTAIPTVQGGLTLAATYDSPFAFDDFSVFGYTGSDGVANTENDVRYGDLNRWSMAFGVQVAPKVSVGLAVSIVTGEDRTIYDHKEDNETLISAEHISNYLGYSLTGGVLYLPADYLKLGFSINMMMSMSVKDTWTKGWYADGYEPNTYVYNNIKADRAPYGAFGAALTLPWMIAALDVRFVMPYTFILPGETIDDAQPRNFKMGAGIGLEVPLPVAAPIVLRAGYSIDDRDFYPVVFPSYDYAYEDIDWTAFENSSPLGSMHTLSFGAAVFTSGAGFELSYGYQTWGLKTRGSYTLEQTYSSHRVTGAIIFRY